MKRLAALCALTLSTLAAHAGVIATTPNETGGTIRLHNVQGECPASYSHLVTVTSAGRYMTGCWRYSRTDDDMLEAYYANGTRYIYPLEVFTTTPYGREMGFAKPVTPEPRGVAKRADQI